MGIVAIVIWSTVIAISRRLTEDLGAMTSGACVYLLAGSIGCLYLAQRGKLRAALALPRVYLLACGGLMVFYTVCLYVALGACQTRQQVVEAGANVLVAGSYIFRHPSYLEAIETLKAAGEGVDS